MSKLPILVIFILFALTDAALAQTRVFDCELSAYLSAREGSELLAKAQSAYAGIKTVKADFEQHSFMAALESSEMSSGEVYFQKPGMMKWHYRQPDEQMFVVRDETLWFYQVAEHQVLIDSLKKVVLTDLPVAFLMGIGDLLRDFRLDKACRNSDGYVFELSQKSGTGEMKAFRLLTEFSSLLPKGAQVTDVGGNVTAVILGQTRFNPELSPDAFSSRFGSGLDIIDRRQGASQPDKGARNE